MADNSSQPKRKLTGAFFQSLDGVIQGGGGPDEDPSGGFRFGGWCVPFQDESVEAETNRLYIDREYDLLLGKRTTTSGWAIGRTTGTTRLERSSSASTNMC